MTKKTFTILIVLFLSFSIFGCTNSGSNDLSKENEQLKTRVALLEGKLTENGIAVPVDNTLTKESVGKEQPKTSTKKGEKFSEITLVVLDKKNRDAAYGQIFIEIPYKAINHYNKEVKGIEGTMHINDMFGKSILSLSWDVTPATPIPVNGFIQVDGYGLDVNQFMDEHMKLYNTTFENLIFKYEPSKVVFTDGTSIE